MSNNCLHPEMCLLSETCIPCAICPNAKEKANDGWLARLVRLHAGRSWTRLTIYLIALLILAPISITFELLRDFCDSAAEWVNDLGRPLQKWADFRKPNANVDLPDTAAQDSASKSNNPAVSG